MEKSGFGFIGKYIIEVDIELKTGLHIGGTEEGFDIGGIDNPVIKDKITGIPYIPGSSLKGKMRSLLEWAYNKVELKEIKELKDGREITKNWEGKLCSDPQDPIGIVFGIAAENHKGDVPGPTRLTVRDATPDEKQRNKWELAMGDNIYTEVKTENSIDRLTSEANPRSMERVPAGSIFKQEFVYDLYKPEDRDNIKLLFEGMVLLEDSYLGGSGTRGSGQVEFKNIKISAKDKAYYIGGKTPILKVMQNGHTTAKDILKALNTVFPPITVQP